MSTVFLFLSLLSSVSSLTISRLVTILGRLSAAHSVLSLVTLLAGLPVADHVVGAPLLPPGPGHGVGLRDLTLPKYPLQRILKDL